MHYEKFSDGTIKCLKDETKFFKIPKSWSFVRIRDIASVKGGKRIPKGKEFSAVPTPHAYIRVTNMKNRTITTSDLKYISDEIYETIRNYTISKTDLYLTIAGTIGLVGEVPDLLDGMNLTENAVKVTPFSINKTFLCFCLLSCFVQNQFQDKTHQVAQPKLAIERILNTIIPLPPLNEQILITNSVKTAFDLVDCVEKQNIALGEIITKTKSKILDLAIRGKLVPQDPNDEPASVLLERIHQEKEGLIKAGKLKRDKRESVIFRGEDNSYYLRTGKLVEPLTDWSFDDLPKNWEICCFGEICNYGDCINTESSVIENSAWILDLEDIEKDTGRIVSRVSKADRPSISTKHKFHKGQVLYSKLRPYLNKVVLADRDGYCTSEILPLEFHAEIIPEYARYYLMSPTFLRYADKCSYGVKMPRLGTNDGKKAIFPLSPINEQRRIVKQIELMFSHLSGIEISVQ